MAELAFRWRGPVLAALGVAVALFARPSPRSLLLGAPWIAAGLLLRAWAFRHLGSSGRTRDPAPPSGRVRTGPYGLLPHPVYVSNLLVVGGLLTTASLSAGAAIAAMALPSGLYLMLAVRESRQLEALTQRPSAGLSPLQLARSERSTWLSVAALLAAQLAGGLAR